MNQIYRFRDRIIWAYHQRKYFPSQKQLSNKIIESVLNNKGEVIVGEFTRQHGKTTVIVDTAEFLLMFYFEICKQFQIQSFPFFNIGFFAPQIQQAQTAFSMLRNHLLLCRNKGFLIDFSIFRGDTITMHDQYPPRQVYCFTASPQSHPESKTLNLIIFDESQDLVDKQVEKAIQPMGAATKATQVFIGVAGYQRCKFWNLIDTLPQENKIIIPVDIALKEREDMYKKTMNPIYLNYREFIEKSIRMAGITEDSDHYKTQFLLQWMLERGQFITYDNLMKLGKEYTLYHEYTEPVFAGLDWGKVHDSTVFTVINQKMQILDWLEFLNDDYSSQSEEIAQFIKRKYINVKYINCDATGQQDMGLELLRSVLIKHNVSTLLRGVTFSTHKDSMYKNLSRLMHDITMNQKIIQPAQLQFPINYPDAIKKEKFIKQFIDLQKEIKNEKWHCDHPEGPQYHDDYTDSLALACYNFRPMSVTEERRFLIG